MNAMPPPALPVRDIMGVAVTAATADDAIRAIDARLARGEHVMLAFMNAHTSNLAGADESYRSLLNRFTVLNDGVGIDIASRILHGERFPENLNGTDFVPLYLARTSRPFRVFLLGARPGVADEAADALLSLAPQHTIAGRRDGYFAPEEAGRIAEDIARTQADVVLVALGNPGQERFIADQFAAMQAPLAIGVGALFDFLSGRVSRAPALVRRLRSEWIYRLALEPGRLWRRYILGNFKFISRLLWVRMGRLRRA
jgi:exopolysaccharide biosynthesis WecB/TagA/CpsF family protein